MESNMTQNEKDRLQYMIDVMQAYKDGKKIECMRLTDEYTKWVMCHNSPIWNWPECDYRIKPESPKPQYRPFESAAEIMEAIKEHGLYINSRFGNRMLIVEFNDTHIWCGASSNPREVSYCLANDYTFADGTPFGKLIEE